MRYALILPDGSIAQTRDFGDETPPSLSVNKGRWARDVVPAYDPATHTATPAPVQASGATDVEYVVAPRDIAVVRSEKLAELTRERLIAQDLPVTVQGKDFPANKEYRELVSNMASRKGRGKPTPAKIRGSNGQEVNLTPALLDGIEDAIAAQVENAWGRFWLRYDAVQAASTVEDVSNVTW